MLRDKKVNTGFTLVEIMVVVAIIGILTATITPQVSGLVDKARKAKAQADVNSITVGILAYVDDNTGTYPGGNIRIAQDGQWLNTYLMATGAAKRYLQKRIENDPWNLAYRFFSCSNYATGHSFVMSRGQDKSCGGGSPYRWGNAAVGDDVVVWIR
ncbi:MAG: type II secretion system protein GspG [Candidatus Omnitrophota bacterium]|nr:type II secretion system protein GspG [Candidatus Omnitrophota bacterium]